MKLVLNTTVTGHSH